jgi:hypothetical protein
MVKTPEFQKLMIEQSTVKSLIGYLEKYPSLMDEKVQQILTDTVIDLDNKVLLKDFLKYFFLNIDLISQTSPLFKTFICHTATAIYKRRAWLSEVFPVDWIIKALILYFYSLENKAIKDTKKRIARKLSASDTPKKPSDGVSQKSKSSNQGKDERLEEEEKLKGLEVLEKRLRTNSASDSQESEAKASIVSSKADLRSSLGSRPSNTNQVEEGPVEEGEFAEFMTQKSPDIVKNQPELELISPIVPKKELQSENQEIGAEEMTPLPFMFRKKSDMPAQVRADIEPEVGINKPVTTTPFLDAEDKGEDSLAENKDKFVSGIFSVNYDSSNFQFPDSPVMSKPVKVTTPALINDDSSLISAQSQPEVDAFTSPVPGFKLDELKRGYKRLEGFDTGDDNILTDLIDEEAKNALFMAADINYLILLIENILVDKETQLDHIKRNSNFIFSSLCFPNLPYRLQRYLLRICRVVLTQILSLPTQSAREIITNSNIVFALIDFFKTTKCYKSKAEILKMFEDLTTITPFGYKKVIEFLSMFASCKILSSEDYPGTDIEADLSMFFSQVFQCIMANNKLCEQEKLRAEAGGVPFNPKVEEERRSVNTGLVECLVNVFSHLNYSLKSILLSNLRQIICVQGSCWNEFYNK